MMAIFLIGILFNNNKNVNLGTVIARCANGCAPVLFTFSLAYIGSIRRLVLGKSSNGGSSGIETGTEPQNSSTIGHSYRGNTSQSNGSKLGGKYSQTGNEYMYPNQYVGSSAGGNEKWDMYGKGRDQNGGNSSYQTNTQQTYYTSSQPASSQNVHLQTVGMNSYPPPQQQQQYQQHTVNVLASNGYDSPASTTFQSAVAAPSGRSMQSPVNGSSRPFQEPVRYANTGGAGGSNNR
ncbi:hypothetical protein HDU76_009715, partial [Blyttiomyces sp. JEL0837]